MDADPPLPDALPSPDAVPSPDALPSPDAVPPPRKPEKRRDTRRRLIDILYARPPLAIGFVMAVVAWCLICFGVPTLLWLSAKALLWLTS